MDVRYLNGTLLSIGNFGSVFLSIVQKRNATTVSIPNRLSALGCGEPARSKRIGVTLNARTLVWGSVVVLDMDMHIYCKTGSN